MIYSLCCLLLCCAGHLRRHNLDQRKVQAKLEDEITAIQLEAELTARSLKTSVAVSQAKAWGAVTGMQGGRRGSPQCGACVKPGAGVQSWSSSSFVWMHRLRLCHSPVANRQCHQERRVLLLQAEHLQRSLSSYSTVPQLSCTIS